MKITLIAIFLAVGLSAGLEPIVKTTLLPRQTCQDAFNYYKEMQDILVVPDTEEKTPFLNRNHDTMGGIAVICDKERNVEVYYFKKSSYFDAEMEFLSGWIFDKCLIEDQKEYEKEIKNQKNTKRQNFLVPEKTSELFYPGNQVDHNVKARIKENTEGQSPNIRKDTIEDKKEFKESKKSKKVYLEGNLLGTKIYQNIYDLEYEIHLYTVKNPCPLCTASYMTLSETFKSLNINVYYSKKFKWTNPNKIFEYKVKNLKNFKTCKSEYSLVEEYIKYEDYMLNCLNTKNLNDLVDSKKANLKFKKISIHSKYQKRLQNIFEVLNLN